MQGHLRKEPLDFLISSKCAQSGRTLHIEIDRDLNYTVQEPEARPLISMPVVDFATLKDRSIIDAY